MTVCDKYHERLKTGDAMAINTAKLASLNRLAREGPTEELAFKPRSEGQESSHIKSQGKNTLP